MWERGFFPFTSTDTCLVPAAVPDWQQAQKNECVETVNSFFFPSTLQLAMHVVGTELKFVE